MQKSANLSKQNFYQKFDEGIIKFKTWCWVRNRWKWVFCFVFNRLKISIKS